MKQSDSKWQAWGKHIPYLLLLGWYLSLEIVLNQVAPSGDFQAHYYRPGGIPVDQFPPILWVELQLYDWLTAGTFNAFDACRPFMHIWGAFLLLSAVLIVRNICRGGMSPYPFIITLIVLFNPCFIYVNLASNDFPTMVFSGLALALCFLWQSNPSFFRWFVILLITTYTVMHRANALLMAPVILLYATQCLPHRFARNVAGKLLITAMSLVCVVAISHIVNYHVIQARKNNAQIVMLQSDLYCMGLLEHGSACYSLKKAVGSDCELYCGKDKDDERQYIMARYILKFHCDHNHELTYPMVRKEWLENVLQSPKAFLATRAVMLGQFFYQGKCPQAIAELVRSHYPHANIPDCTPYADHLCGSSIIIRVLGIPLNTTTTRNLVVGSFLLFILLMPFLFLVHRKDLLHTPILTLSLAAYGTALGYLLSFLPFTPTPDCRYLTTCLAMYTFSVGAYATFLWNKKQASA